MKRIIPLAAGVLLSLALNAQPQGNPQKGRPEPPKMKSATEMATEMADKMLSEVGLDQKQYKKIYKFFKKDFEYRENLAKSAMQGGMPPQGGGPGIGGGMMGGGPGMGGGMMGGGPGMGGGMPMGGGPGMGGGMPMGGSMPPQGDMQGKRPEGGPGMGPGGMQVSEEYLEKQDNKLRKILSPEQYDKWRVNHPAEHLELPPLELEPVN